MNGPPESITCPRCGMTSHNPNDAAHRYCGNCRMFHGDMGDTVTAAGPPINHLADLWKLNAQGWKQMYRMQRRAALWAAVPGLMCGIGVFTSAEAGWGLNALAGMAIAASTSVLLSGAVSLWKDHQPQSRAIDRILAERFWDEHEGEPMTKDKADG